MEASPGKYCVTSCENEEREPWTLRNVGVLSGSWEDKETVSPLKPPEENIALETLDLSQVGPCQTRPGEPLYGQRKSCAV